MKVKKPNYITVFKAHASPKTKAKLASSLWVEVIEHLTENDLLTKPRVRLADRYVRVCVEYEALYPQAMKNGPTLKSKKKGGGEYANMKWHAVGNLNQQILKFEESLMILPKAAGDKLESKKPQGKKTPADEFLKKVN